MMFSAEVYTDEFLWSLPVSKASSVSQIRTAEAVASDMGEERAVETGVHQWAKCGLRNSERDVQKVLKKQGTKLDVRVEEVVCDGTLVPCITPETWLEWIVNHGLWPSLAGCSLGDYEGAQQNWAEFWRTYEKIHPEFDLFTMDGVDYSRTAAMFVHGDEGRTLKRQGILVTSLQSALGRGFDEKRLGRPNDVRNRKLQVNFAGHTFTTRFVCSTIPKTAYDVQPELFHDNVKQMVISCRKLLDKGFTDKSRGETFRVVILGVKGDAPYLSKVGHFYRSYNTTTKRGTETSDPKGCCPYCLAGTRLCKAEEIATAMPSWIKTIGVKLPWVREPEVIKNLVHDRSSPADFFKSDIWHVFHLGFGRSWIASVVQLVLPQLPCQNLDEKWDFLTEHYLRWCERNKKQAHVSRITAYLMSYNDSSGTRGEWHKGALTSNLMGWLVDLLGDIPRDNDGFHMRCREATYRMNAKFSLLYRSGAFLNFQESTFVVEQGLNFLEIYYGMAVEMFGRGRQWMYPLYPKAHIYHHLILQVLWQAKACDQSVNPLLYACQMDEDMIGKASRLSRRVNIRLTASRSLDRYLTAAYSAMVDAGVLAWKKNLVVCPLLGLGRICASIFINQITHDGFHLGVACGWLPFDQLRHAYWNLYPLLTTHLIMGHFQKPGFFKKT